MSITGKDSVSGENPFNLYEQSGPFGMLDRTLDLDAGEVDEVRIGFLFKRLKDERDVRRSRTGVLSFIDFKAEAEGVRQLSESLEKNPSEKLQNLLDKRSDDGDEMIWAKIKENALRDRKLKDESSKLVKMSRANQRLMRIAEERKLGYEMKGLSTRIKSMDAGRRENYTKAINDVNRAVKKISSGCSEAHKVFRSHMTQDRVSTLWNWFTAHDQRIKWSRREIPTYQDIDSDVSRKIAEEAKVLFAEFRLVIDCPDWFHTGNMQTELMVPFDLVLDINKIIADMRKETSFEGTPAPSDPEKLIRMVTRLNEVTEVWKTAEFWDENTISLTEGKAIGAPTAIATHLSILTDQQLTAYAANLTNKPTSQVKSLLLTAVDTARELKNEITKRQASEETNPMMGSQIANLDRLFHFYYLIWRTCPEACPGPEQWQRIYRFLDAVPAQSINQDNLPGILTRCPIRELSSIRFDDVGGFGGLHKYQHPMMISAKRWANGAAAGTKIGAVAQGLNLFSNQEEGMRFICDLDRALVSKQTIELGVLGLTGNLEIMYSRLRITFWLMHALLKGDTSASSWTGLVKGNALQVGIERITR